MNTLWDEFSRKVKQAPTPCHSSLRKYFVLWVFIIGLAAWFSEGWIQPDEHARILEPAHMIAYGYASLPWEFNDSLPIVSWFLGYLISPLFFITKYLGASGITEAAVARFLVGIFSSSKFFALWYILDFLKTKPSRKPFYLLITMTIFFGPLFLVRTSQETFATTFLIWAFYFALKIKEVKYSFKDAFLFGIALAFVASARPQVGISAAGIGIWLLFSIGPVIVLPSLIGIIIGLLPIAIIDFETTGKIFLPAINYLHYALGDEQGGQVWGTSPWWFYIQQYFEIFYPPVSIFLIAPFFYGLRRGASLACVFIPFAVVHFILGHKEARYFSPMIPFMQLAVIIGWEHLEQISELIARWTNHTQAWAAAVKIVLVLTILSAMIPINSSPRMYQKLGEKIRSGEITDFTYIGNTMTGISLFFAKLPVQPQFKHVPWNDLKSGIAKPQGWLAFYALDPADFRVIEDKCQIKDLKTYPEWYLNLLEVMPKSPARRKLNPIIYCKEPLILTAN